MSIMPACSKVETDKINVAKALTILRYEEDLLPF
jgi:hypothetical protein